MVRGTWRQNRAAIYWPPLLMPSALCLSRSPGLLNRRPRASSLLDDGFLYCILSATSLYPNSIGGSEGPFGLVWLSLSYLVSYSNFWPPSNGLSHFFSTAYEYRSFLSSFFLSPLKYRVFFSKPPKPLSTQPTTFLPQNNLKSSPWIFEHMQWDHQNSAHILNIQSPNAFFPEIFPNKTSQSHSSGELTK